MSVIYNETEQGYGKYKSWSTYHLALAKIAMCQVHCVS